AMMQDIRRMCENATEEDRRWFPDIAGSDWLETHKFAMRTFKAERFILQYLSLRVIRELKLFAIVDDEQNYFLEVAAIHHDSGYGGVLELLASQNILCTTELSIQVGEVASRGGLALLLRLQRHAGKPLGKTTEHMLKHLQRLWGFDIHLQSMDGETLREEIHMPPRSSELEERLPRFDMNIPPI